MELKKKHQLELDSFRVEIENGTVQCPRLHFSGSIIEMQKRADYLGQCGFYKDAKALKRQIKNAKQIEREKFNMEVDRNCSVAVRTSSGDTRRR